MEKKYYRVLISDTRLGVVDKCFKRCNSLDEGLEYLLCEILSKVKIRSLLEILENCKCLSQEHTKEAFFKYLQNPNEPIKFDAYAKCEYCPYKRHYICGRPYPPCSEHSEDSIECDDYNEWGECGYGDNCDEGCKYCSGCDKNIQCPVAQDYYGVMAYLGVMVHIENQATYIIYDGGDSRFEENGLYGSDDVFDYCLEVQCPDCDMIAKIKSYKIRNSGEFALMILHTLLINDVPKTATQIVCSIQEHYGTEIKPNTVTEHLKSMRALGFNITKIAMRSIYNKIGYKMGDNFTSPTENPPEDISNRQFGHREYPLMILKVLTTEPQTQTQIAEAVEQRYGVRIERKAISRHLKKLGEYDFSVKREKNGKFFIENPM